jgi:hypothetical protein
LDEVPSVDQRENNISNINGLAFYHLIRWSLEIFGIKGRFQEVLAPLMPRGSHRTILEALTSILEAHPGMWPGMALYWLRRHAAE